MKIDFIFIILLQSLDSVTKLLVRLLLRCRTGVEAMLRGIRNYVKSWRVILVLSRD